MDHLKRFAAELFGTFALCAIAMLVMAGVTQGDAARLVTVPAYGLGVLAAMHACGSLGPVHLNPAVRSRSSPLAAGVSCECWPASRGRSWVRAWPAWS